MSTTAYRVIKSSTRGYFTGKRGKKKWSHSILLAKRYYDNHSAGCARARLNSGSDYCEILTLLREVKY